MEDITIDIICIYHENYKCSGTDHIKLIMFENININLCYRVTYTVPVNENGYVCNH